MWLAERLSCRVGLERDNDESVIPAAARLTPETTAVFVDTICPLILRGLYSKSDKMAECSRSALKCVSQLLQVNYLI